MEWTTPISDQEELKLRVLVSEISWLKSHLMLADRYRSTTEISLQPGASDSAS